MRTPTRFPALCTALLAMSLSACSAGPSDCSIDSDCGAGQYCDHTFNGVKGFCRDEGERPLDEDAGAPDEDGGAPAQDGGLPATDGGVRLDAGLADGGVRLDAGLTDGGVRLDGGLADGGVRPDGGVRLDGGLADAGAPDAGPVDTDGDGVPDGADNCPGVYNPQQEDQDRDGVGDACDSCPSIANPRGTNGQQDPVPCRPRPEVEPNDDAATAQAVTLPGVWSGVIEPAGDLDVFVFAAEPGTYLRVDIDTSGGDLNAALAVVGLDPSNAGYQRAFDEPTRKDLSRELFLAAGGRYALAVTDARNATWRVGGPTFTYRMTISTPFLPADVPRVTALPFTRTDALAPIGALRFYTLALAQPGLARAEVTALRGGSSDLDAALTVYDPTTRTVLADNRDQDLLTPDPRALVRLPGDRELLLVVEPETYAVLPGTPVRASYRLDVSTLPEGVELEPNDSAQTATPVPVPVTLAGTIALTGPLGGQLGDRDVFRFNTAIGTLVRVRAQPTGGGLRAALEVRDPTGKQVVFHRDATVTGAVAEVLVTQAGEYTAWLDDRVNLDARASGTGAFVGGSTYGYSLTTEVLTLAATPLTTTPIPATAPAGGSTYLQHVATTTGSLVVRCDDPATGFEPWVRIHDRGSLALLAEGRPPIEHFVGPATFLISVSDAGGKGGSGYTCSASAGVTMTVGATAAEPNDQRGQASPLAPPAAHAQAALGTASDVDWYKVSAPFPSALSAYVQGPVAPHATLRAYSADGHPLAEAALDGQKLVLPSFGPGKLGDIFFEVRSPGGAVGNYTIVARLETTCPHVPGTRRATGGVDAFTPPALADRPLWLSEVYPGNSAMLDANGDGFADAAQDEFVELYNPSATQAVDLGGVSLSDNVQVRFTFPCGSVLPPQRAAVVFGGGRPLGDFGGALVFSSKESSRLQELGLNNDGDTLTVLDPDGRAIDRFSWSSATTCREFSCALDLDHGGDALIRQNLITGASGSFSPGRRPSGALFSGASAAPAGDLCASAPAVAVDLQSPVTLALDARNATDNYTASCGLPGRDVVYTVAPGTPVSVDFFPSAGVRSLSLRQSCDRDAAELSQGCATGPLSFDSLPAGSYGLFVEADGLASVRAEFGPPRAPSSNIECFAALDLSSSASATHRANTRSGGKPCDSACTPELDEEPALWYQFTLPTARRVRITATASWRPLITLLSACGGRVLGCGDPQLELPTLPAGNYRFAVSGRGVRDGDSGLYDVLVSTDAAVPAPARNQCEGATAVSGLLQNESTLGASDNYRPPPSRSAACSALPSELPGSDLLYPIVLSAGATLTATATPKAGSGLDLVLYLLSSCTDVGRCLAGVDAGAAEAAETLSYTNSGPISVTVYLVVDSRASAVRGLFDLEVRTQ